METRIPGIVVMFFGLLIVFSGLISLLGLTTAFEISVTVFGTVTMFVGFVIWVEGGAR